MGESQIQIFIKLLGGKMANIERLLQDLQSDNPEKRLNACERLLFSLGIPDNAIEALRKATKDSDPDVADMARKALDIQLHDRRMNARNGETGG
jgi:hypothetical protein